MLDFELFKDDKNLDEDYFKMNFPKFDDDIIQLLVKLNREKVLDFTSKKKKETYIPVHISNEPVVLRFD